MDIARIKRFLAGMALLLLAGLAQAGNLNFNGGAVASCTRSGANYSCGTLALGSSDSVTIASGYAVTVTGGTVAFGSNQGLTMSGSAALTVNGSLDIGSIKSSNLHVGGGTLTASNGDFSMSGQTLTANIGASGQITLGNGSVVTGNLVAPIVELSAAHVEVNGDVTASDSLFIGANNALYGDVVAGTVTLHAANAYIGGNARVDRITLGNKGKVAGLITCNGGTAAVPCNCVTNNSHYDLGTPDGPRCVAPAPPPPPAGPHHILITHDGTGLTCQPETVTLTACANAACTVPHYSGRPSVTLTPGEQPFVIPAGGVSTVATVRQTTPATIALKAVSSPAALNQSTCSNISTSPSSTSCNMAFADTGFEMSIANHVSNKSTAITLRALRTTGNREVCGPLFEGNRSVVFTCSHVNPGSGERLVLLGSATDPVSTCGAAVGLTFNSAGTAEAWMKYADVGQIGINASYAPTSGSDAGLRMSGSTTVVVAPASFYFDRIWDGGTPGVDNPQLADDVFKDTVFVKAGRAFSAKVSARNFSFDPDNNSSISSNNTVTPNFGKESPAQTVKLAHKLVLPITTPDANIGALSGGAPWTWAAGVGTSVNLAWNEVGVIDLSASLDNQYGYLGVEGAPTMDVEGKLLIAAGRRNVGRFIPDHFDTVVLPASNPYVMTQGVPMLCAASLLDCANAPPGFDGAPPGFAYAGQEFTLKVMAKNAKDGVTVNYSGELAKATTLTGWLSAGGDSRNTSGDLRYAAPATALVLGPERFLQGESKTPQSYVYSTIPSPPSNVYFRAVDTDGASSLRDKPIPSDEGGLMIVSGRMLIPNNYGSELLPMTINLRAQLRNAAGAWVTNTADGDALISGSPVVPSALRFIGCTKNLVDSKTAACKAALQVASPVGGKVNFVNGLAAFRLLAPGAGNNGSANLQFLAPGNPSSVFLPSPPGQATFGIYKAGPVIYLRELY